MDDVSRPKVGEVTYGLFITGISSIADHCRTLSNDANSYFNTDCQRRFSMDSHCPGQVRPVSNIFDVGGNRPEMVLQSGYRWGGRVFSTVLFAACPVVSNYFSSWRHQIGSGVSEWFPVRQTHFTDGLRMSDWPNWVQCVSKMATANRKNFFVAHFCVEYLVHWASWTLLSVPRQKFENRKNIV